MSKKSIAIIFTTLFFIVFVSLSLVLVFRKEKSPGSAVLDAALRREISQLREENGDLAPFALQIETWEKKLEEDPSRSESYLTLGLAWKSLADQTKDPRYYARARDLYERGAQVTERKSTVFLVNAGYMEEFLGNYESSERYYQEGLTAAPGDDDIYIRLADLYRYHLGKSPEEIIAFLDTGIATVVPPDRIIRFRARYIESTGFTTTTP